LSCSLISRFFKLPEGVSIRKPSSSIGIHLLVPRTLLASSQSDEEPEKDGGETRSTVTGYRIEVAGQQLLLLLGGLRIVCGCRYCGLGHPLMTVTSSSSVMACVVTDSNLDSATFATASSVFKSCP
jgi:hypothetical protein